MERYIQNKCFLREDDKIYINNFSLSIGTGHGNAQKINRHGTEYFVLENESEYIVELYNANDVKCDAFLYIDGNHVGTWRVDPHRMIRLARPMNANKKFTFIMENSQAAKSVGLVKKSDNGLIKVVFTPLKIYTLEDLKWDTIVRLVYNFIIYTNNMNMKKQYSSLVVS